MDNRSKWLRQAGALIIVLIALVAVLPENKEHIGIRRVTASERQPIVGEPKLPQRVEILNSTIQENEFGSGFHGGHLFGGDDFGAREIHAHYTAGSECPGPHSLAEWLDSKKSVFLFRAANYDVCRMCDPVRRSLTGILDDDKAPDLPLHSLLCCSSPGFARTPPVEQSGGIWENIGPQLTIAGFFRSPDQAASSLIESYGRKRQNHSKKSNNRIRIVMHKDAQAISIRAGDYAESGNIIFRGLIAGAVCGLIYALLKRA